MVRNSRWTELIIVERDDAKGEVVDDSGISAQSF